MYVQHQQQQQQVGRNWGTAGLAIAWPLTLARRLNSGHCRKISDLLVYYFSPITVMICYFLTMIIHDYEITITHFEIQSSSSVFYRTQVSLGSDLWVRFSETKRPFADLTDVTLAPSGGQICN